MGYALAAGPYPYVKMRSCCPGASVLVPMRQNSSLNICTYSSTRLANPSRLTVLQMALISSAWSWWANFFGPAPPIYQPLEHHEIRLVVLHPAKWHSPIECHLIIKCLDEDLDYQALSYFWGDPKALRPISPQGRSVQISRNLESSLRHLRYEDRERTLWIDALSINQGDSIEKTQQVRQMHLIYARTHRLVVWVGDRSEDSDTAMQAIRRIGREQEGEDTWDVVTAHPSSMAKEALSAGDSFDPKPWVALNRLFRRPWFERVWIVQEICLPDRAITFVCGKEEDSWASVVKTDDAVRSCGRYWNYRQVLSMIEAGWVVPAVDGVSAIHLRRFYRLKGLKRNRTLLYNLWATQYRKGTDNRDKIFAIRGLCSDLNPGDIPPDYSLATERVYSETAAFILNKYQQVNILGACQLAGRNIEKLPSWAPDWTIDPIYRPIRPFLNWGNGGEDGNLYHAATGQNSLAKIQISIDLSTLTLRGLIFSRIVALGVRIGNETGKDMTPAGWASFRSWWPMAKHLTPPFTTTPSGYKEPRLEKFWRTIIADTCNGKKVRASEQDLQFSSWMKRLYPGGFEGKVSMAESSSDDVQDSTSYMASFQQATTNRRFFVTENGRMGLAPLDSEPGDLVCLIVKSPVPFILRPCQRDIDTSSSPSSSPHSLEPKSKQLEEYFVLVGECYCHGMMEGEELKPQLLRDLILM